MKKSCIFYIYWFSNTFLMKHNQGRSGRASEKNFTRGYEYRAPLASRALVELV